MAQVDFDSANIEIIGTHQPLRQQYLGLSDYNNPTSIIYFLSLSEPWTALSTGLTMTVLTNTASKYSLRFRGTFRAAGTEFGIYLNKAAGSSYDFFWKVTNISFNANDTFDFVIDVDITGS